jgi:hypothetical protein
MRIYLDCVWHILLLSFTPKSCWLVACWWVSENEIDSTYYTLCIIHAFKPNAEREEEEQKREELNNEK